MTRPAWVQMLRWIALVTVVTVIATLTGGTLVWLAERHHPEANLQRWGDGVWWAVTTLSTVGYGDHAPVTLLGRLVAVSMMACGVAIIGAVAAVVAFAFASRLTSRLEAAVHHMESQVEQVEAEMENVRVGDGGGGSAQWHRPSGLRELVIGVADSDTAGSLTWLLARLGWHPEATESGMAWRDGGVLLRVAVRPWDQPFGVQGRLTFGAGSPERLARIAREAARHGFRRVSPRTANEPRGAEGGIPAPTPAPMSGRSTSATPSGAGDGANGQPADRSGRRQPPSAVRELPDTGALAEIPVDGQPVTLRAVSGFEVVLVTS